MDGPSLHDRLRGGLYGLLVGDALGVPYEFHPPEEIPRRDRIEMTPPPGFDRSHRVARPGTWSDDGAQALCLLESLLERGRLDVIDFAARLLAWADRGHLAVDGVVFDIGIQTAEALRRLRSGVSPEVSGAGDEWSNGNGSLMRVLPLALWHTGTDDALVRDAYAQSAITHGHAQSRVCCALYVLWARRILEGRGDPWREAVVTMRELTRPGTEERVAMGVLDPERIAVGRGSGYVVDTLRSAAALAHLRYEDAVREAIALGEDTDTTACVVGGIAGIRWGETSIPLRWRDVLLGQETVEPLLQRLRATRE
jgi:ADP-ribosyl-[dinitrogen reductase] hydrolase